MIHMLPYLEHTIRTRKSPQEIHDIMQSVTSPKGEWFSSKRGEFIGEIDQYEFKIESKILYRNDFLPVIKGTIKQGEGAYEVVLKMQPNLSTYIFLIIWYGLLGVFFFDWYFPSDHIRFYRCCDGFGANWICCVWADFIEMWILFSGKKGHNKTGGAA